MNPSPRLFFLTVILVITYSCSEKHAPPRETASPKFVRNSKSDTLTFTSGVKAIFQDRNGNYWFGSHNEGVCRFDGRSFEYFTMREGLADHQIRSIKEDKDGTIWFGTANGVSSYDGQKITTHTSSVHASPQNEWLKPIHEASTYKWAKAESDLWFNAGTQEGTFRYDGQQVYYLPFPDQKASITGNVYSVTGITEGKHNMLWFGTFAGVIGYNGRDFTIINDETLANKHKNEQIHIRSILEDSKARLWIGNNGIGVLLKEDNSIINFSKKYEKLLPMERFAANTMNKDFSKNTGLQAVFAIAEDSKGNIWFGDRDTGAWKYDGESLTNYTVDKELPSQMIWTIYEDQKQNLLFGMAHGGVYQFNGKSFEKRF